MIPVRCVQGFKNGAYLQSDEDKRENVEDEDYCLPYRIRRHPYSSRESRGHCLRHRDGEANHRQDARKANAVREDPDAEDRNELKKDCCWYVMNLRKQSNKQPP